MKFKEFDTVKILRECDEKVKIGNRFFGLLPNERMR